MSAYKYGERVWALAEGQWWPGKVVLGSVYGIPHSENEVVVKYYSADPDASDFDVLVDSMLAPYEESSEKAVTLDEALMGAMEACRNDTDALPLRELPVVSSKRARDGDEGEGAASKHHRREKKQHADAAYSNNGYANAGSSSHGAGAERPSSSGTGSKSIAISRFQSDLIRATNSNDVINARRALLKLGNMKMTYDMLRETRVGVSVANLLGLESFKALHPLARAIVCDWAQKLPEETIKAIKHELEVTHVAEHK